MEDLTIDERISRLEELQRNFQIISGSNVNIDGSLELGYNVCSTCPEALGNPGGGAGPSPTGACCVDTTCSITTSAGCALAGGTYKGNDVPCIPNPCVSGSGACCLNGDCSILTESECSGSGGTFQGAGTSCDDVDCGQATSGACCVESDCTIETPSDCNGMGGVYQGDNTACDPNPCGISPCACTFQAFSAFDGSGRKFNTRSAIFSGNANLAGPFHITMEFSGEKIENINIGDCTASCTCTGSASSSSDVGNGSASVSGCSSLGSDDFCGYVSGCTFINAIGGPPPCQHYPDNVACRTPSESHTATTQTLTFHCEQSGGAQTWDATITYTLSNECTP